MSTLVTFRGKVKNGEKRGKLLGFPTANIFLHIKIPEGIYASKVIIDKKTYQAATFIGSAKTFGEKDYKAECFILDFQKDIYGKWIKVTLFKKIRENKKFNSPEELIYQMKKDVQEIREFLNQIF